MAAGWSLWEVERLADFIRASWPPQGPNGSQERAPGAGALTEPCLAWGGLENVLAQADAAPLYPQVWGVCSRTQVGSMPLMGCPVKDTTYAPLGVQSPISLLFTLPFKVSYFKLSDKVV